MSACFPRTKAERQDRDNVICLYMFNRAKAYFDEVRIEKTYKLSNNAIVQETSRYLYLLSYNSLIAIIDRETGECFDLLRRVYEYTNTSSRHINKFCKAFDAAAIYTYR